MLTLGAMLLIFVVLAAFLVGMHGGPHAAIVAGAAAFGAAAILLVVILVRASSTGSLDLVAGGITAAAALATAGLVAFGFSSLAAARKTAPPALRDELWKHTGVALTDLSPTGTVKVGGETWSAEAIDGPIKAGTEVMVMEVHGLVLKVAPDPLRLESQ